MPDRDVLEALFSDATDGSNWAVSTNWLSDWPLGEWHGVTTDAEGRVTGLFLQNNGLEGPVPAVLGDLSNNLAALYLAGNSLTGCIPASLRNVPLNDFALLGLPFCQE